MPALSKTFNMSRLCKRSGKSRIALFVLLGICLFGRLAKAQYVGGNEVIASAETSTYAFLSEQSKVVKVGGFAGVHETYHIEGQFELSVDFDAGTAWFGQVDANLVNESGLLYERSLGIIFNMAELLGTVVDDTIIEFVGKTTDGMESTILLTLTFRGDSTHLAGRTVPPPNSADFFIFELDAVAWKKYGGGSGEANGPYLIYTAEQMNAIGAEPNDWDKHFKLMADIDLSSYTGTDFNIIGTYSPRHPFTGVFDGNGHKISNFNYTSIDTDYIGLFVYIADPNAEIKDLRLIDPNIEAGTGHYVGSLAGWFGEGTITGCYVVGGCISGDGYVGGLVGIHGEEYGASPFHFASISHSYSTAKVSGRHDLGGLAGYMRPYSSITDCHATGSVYGKESSWYLGGLVGGNNYGTIQDCYATGSISAGKESERLGGLLGSYTNGSIDNCFASGSVSGGENSKRLGGLVGDIFIGTIANCYATGSVYGGADSQYLGGLVGYQASNGTIDSCYSIGSVHGGEGAEDIGGLVGYFTGGPGYTIYGFTMKCFWDVEASGIQTSNGGMGLTTAQMMDSETYSLNGWAGNPNWIIDDGKDYPRLVWEGTAGQTIPEPVIDWFDGSGIQNDPYIIATADQLALVGKASVLWDKRFILISDLDLTGIDILRIGICNGMEFTGYFDGNGHVIHNLTVGVRDVSGLALSLFGLIGGSGQVSHLGLENVTILGGENSERLGGLVGENRGMVTHCYATGSVSGRDGSRRLGGLVGFNRKGTVTNCYATVSVSGGDSIGFLGGLVGDNNGTITNCYADSTISGGTDSRCMGGLAGLNWSRITHCYATGSVTGGYSNRFLGGLVGSNSGSINSSYATGSVSGGPGTVSPGGLVGDYWEDATITNCYFLAPSDGGGPDNRQGLSLTDEQMRQRASFVGWDFVGQTDGPHDIWAEPLESGYPILSWQLPPGFGLPTFSGGNGEPDDSFLILTTTELNSISDNPRLMGAHFKLINDIDLTDVEFFIIGSEVFPFAGVFEGNGHTISNFTHTSTDTDHIGLFGYVDGPDAEIKDLGLIDPNIDAGTGSTIGSLVGYNKGTVSGCYVQSVSVTGYSGVGGLVGHNDSTITDCYVTGSISGAGSVGGLVGGNGYESITNCYVIGSISGEGWVGGLVGYNFGTTSRCYVTGSVSADDEVGGLVGHNYDAINECFATAGVSGTSNIGGLVGNNEGTITECYSYGDISGDNSVGGLVGCTGRMYFYPVPYALLNCYSIGNISGSADFGGLVGYNELYVYWTEIRNCYAIGGVYGTKDVGGLVGFNYESEVISSFWDIETSGLITSASGTGKTTAEMQVERTFTEAGWDFVDETVNGTEDIWWILEDQDYPRLWWEMAEDDPVAVGN